MPKGISIGPRGTSAYVTNMGSDTMTQISLKQQHRLGVEVGSARWRGRRGCPRTPGNDAADLGG